MSPAYNSKPATALPTAPPVCTPTTHPLPPEIPPKLSNLFAILLPSPSETQQSPTQALATSTSLPVPIALTSAMLPPPFASVPPPATSSTPPLPAASTCPSSQTTPPSPATSCPLLPTPSSVLANFATPIAKSSSLNTPSPSTTVSTKPFSPAGASTPAPVSGDSPFAPTNNHQPHRVPPPHLCKPSALTTCLAFRLSFSTSMPPPVSLSVLPGLPPSKPAITLPGPASPTPTLPSTALVPTRPSKATCHSLAKAFAPPSPSHSRLHRPRRQHLHPPLRAKSTSVWSPSKSSTPTTPAGSLSAPAAATNTS